MKIFSRVLCIIICSYLFQSCYVDRYVSHYVSALDDLCEGFVGQDKNYIISQYPSPITDVKYLDDQHEILIFKRYRPLGEGVTYFYMKDGKCYRIATNEYKIEKRLEKVSIFSNTY